LKEVYESKEAEGFRQKLELLKMELSNGKVTKK
jgi:hypothetical protein